MNSLLPYLLTWLQEYGYPILWLSIFIGALGIPLPNTLLLLAAGAFAALGDFNFAWLAMISISAFVIGDSGSYWIGRLWGSKVLAWLEKTGYLIKPRTIASSRIYFNRLGGWAIFLSHFPVAVLGSAINLLAGAELYSYRRFVLYDLGGEALSALLRLTLGYIFGASWEAVGNILGSFSLFFPALVVVLVLGYQALRLFQRMRRSAQAQNKLGHSEPDFKESLEASTATPDLPGTSGLSAPSSNLPL